MSNAKLSTILVVADHGDADRALFQKAVLLARSFGARIHLFSCNAELAYTLRHSYDQRHVQASWRTSISEHRSYLEALRRSVPAPDVDISIDAVCDSPYYEAIVRKVASIHPDLVMKSAASVHPVRRFTLDSNDWQLMRACPVTMMLVRGSAWRKIPRFAAMVDVSNHETPELAAAIARISERIVSGCHAELDLVYSERSDREDWQSNRSTLDQLARENGVVAEHVHVLSGDPDVALSDFARQSRYDVLVLGALTHRRGIAALLGTLTGRLIDTLDCDFILVRGEPDSGKVEVPVLGQTGRVLPVGPPSSASIQ